MVFVMLDRMNYSIQNSQYLRKVHFMSGIFLFLYEYINSGFWCAFLCIQTIHNEVGNIEKCPFINVSFDNHYLALILHFFMSCIYYPSHVSL